MPPTTAHRDLLAATIKTTTTMVQTVYLHVSNWFAHLLVSTEVLWIAEWAGALLAIGGALVMSMNRGWSRHAWAIWIASNVLLIAPIAYGHRWGLLMTQFAFLMVNINGLLRHRRRARPSPRRTTNSSRCAEGLRRDPIHRRGIGARYPNASLATLRRVTPRQRVAFRRPLQISHQPTARSYIMIDDNRLPESNTAAPVPNDSDRRYYVYQFVDPLAPETVLYVGKGTGDRIHDHAADARAYNKALAAGLRPRAGRFVRKHAKILRAGRRLTAERRLTNLKHQEALDEERKLIAEIGRIEDGGSLLNLSPGGEGVDPAVTSSEPHRARARRQIRRVNSDPLQVRARVERLHELHADPVRHAAAVATMHRASHDPLTKAKIAAAATAGRKQMLADPIRRAKLIAACSRATRNRLANPAERAKHKDVMRKVHAHPDWRKKVVAGARAARVRPGWQAAFERGMARRNADGLHGARTREGLRRKRRNDPVYSAEASARGRAAMGRLHADPKVKALHRARMAALHKNPELDAWRRARQQWHYACRRAAKNGLPPPPAPKRDEVPRAALSAGETPSVPANSASSASSAKTRPALRRYSTSAAKQPGQRSLAQLIKFHKKRVGVTYRQLAAASGVSVGTLWELANSQQVAPSLDTLHRVAWVLGFSLAEVAPPS